MKISCPTPAKIVTVSSDVALITGASSGLGVHFARELAKRQWNLIITARREARLLALQSELQKEFGVRVQMIPLDLAEPHAARRLLEAVDALGHTVRVLINNAGVGHYGPVVDQTVASIENMIQLNLGSLTMLTRLFSERMREKGGGHVLQNASFSGFTPMPRYAVYAATKSYVVSMAQAMRYELRRHNVNVSVLCPGFSQSGFFENAGHEPTRLMRMMTLDPSKVADAGIRGLFRNRAVIVPGLVYKAYAMTLRLLPRSLACALAAAVIKNQSSQVASLPPTTLDEQGAT